jgi:hypothetical protein
MVWGFIGVKSNGKGRIYKVLTVNDLCMGLKYIHKGLISNRELLGRIWWSQLIFVILGIKVKLRYE